MSLDELGLFVGVGVSNPLVFQHGTGISVGHLPVIDEELPHAVGRWDRCEGAEDRRSCGDEAGNPLVFREAHGGSIVGDSNGRAALGGRDLEGVGGGADHVVIGRSADTGGQRGRRELDDVAIGETVRSESEEVGRIGHAGQSGGGAVVRLHAVAHHGLEAHDIGDATLAKGCAAAALAQVEEGGLLHQVVVEGGIEHHGAHLGPFVLGAILGQEGDIFLVEVGGRAGCDGGAAEIGLGDQAENVLDHIEGELVAFQLTVLDRVEHRLPAPLATGETQALDLVFVDRDLAGVRRGVRHQ